MKTMKLDQIRAADAPRFPQGYSLCNLDMNLSWFVVPKESESLPLRTQMRGFSNTGGSVKVKISTPAISLYSENHRPEFARSSILETVTPLITADYIVHSPMLDPGRDS